MQKELKMALIMGIVGICIVRLLMPHKAQGYEPIKKPIIIEEPTKVFAETPVSCKKSYFFEPTEEEVEIMARVVMSEASILPIEAKEAIAQVIINRVLSGDFPDSIKEVIEQKNQFSTADNGEPTEDCYTAVEAACKYGPFPVDLLFFRAGYYHPWGYPYMKIGNTYFTTAEKNYNQEEKQ